MVLQALKIKVSFFFTNGSIFTVLVSTMCQHRRNHLQRGLNYTHTPTYVYTIYSFKWKGNKYKYNCVRNVTTIMARLKEAGFGGKMKIEKKKRTVTSDKMNTDNKERGRNGFVKSFSLCWKDLSSRCFFHLPITCSRRNT